MPEKLKDIHPPRGLARLAFRLPILFYRIGLGCLLGGRFLLLTHTGRKSGLPRKTVLEVVRHDPTDNRFIVAVGFGKSTDWYQNVLKSPRVTVQCGRRSWPMFAQTLTAEQAGEELLDYQHRHPLAWQELSRFMGYRTDGSPEDIRQLGSMIALVQFQSLEE